MLQIYVMLLFILIKCWPLKQYYVCTYPYIIYYIYLSIMLSIQVYYNMWQWQDIPRYNTCIECI